MSKPIKWALLVIPLLAVTVLMGRLLLQSSDAQQLGPFRLEEATIADVHRAIQQGQITCRGLVQAYIDRAKAYNGVSDRLVTRDGAPIPVPKGTIRAGAPLKFPTETVAVSTLLPDFERYVGPPIEFGRMEPTSSDPDVQQQYGMTVGTPDSRQINALGTLNLRGERSVTCKGDRDRHPSSGPLRAGSPPVCAEFRKQPDALERAAELDAQYGRAPDLAALPMYCIPFSFKDPFDTMDMRTTAAADARYDMDFPARDHTLVAQLRQKGAIVYAKAVNTEYNGIPADPGGRHEPEKILVSDLGVPAQQLVRKPAQRVRFDSGGIAGIELGVWRFGERQSRHVQHLRGDEHVVPRPGEPQLRGADSAAQGHGVVSGRGHWRRHPQRPLGHPLPQCHRFREGARCPEGSGERLLRSARRVHNRPARERPADFVCGGGRLDTGHGWCVEGDSHRRHSGIDAEVPRHQGGRANR